MKNYDPPAIAVVDIEFEGAILSASESWSYDINVTGQSSTDADVSFGSN